MPENGLCEDVTCRTFICKPGFEKDVGDNLGTVTDKGDDVNVGRDLNEGTVCIDINECEVWNPLLTEYMGYNKIFLCTFFVDFISKWESLVLSISKLSDRLPLKMKDNFMVNTLLLKLYCSFRTWFS